MNINKSLKKFRVLNSAIFILFFLIFGCGSENEEAKSSSESTIVKKENYKYCFIFFNSLNQTTGCSTGPKEFNNKLDYCNELVNHENNNYCSWESRKVSFTSNGCPGEFTAQDESLAVNYFIPKEQYCE